jgi:hypothetical protein
MGRRNNPAEATEGKRTGIKPLAVYNPLHFQELPEAFMDFVGSLTGKSPSTTGAGSEGALTKGPFNALRSIHDLNNALVSYVLTGLEIFSTPAGHVGRKYQVDHDLSLLMPEIWARLSAEERSAESLIAGGYLERVRDLRFSGKTVAASRLGWRINRVYTHERELGAFDSKHITRPGNLKAIEYLERTYRSYGYEPELQWFTPTALQASGGRTANVVATLRGTEHPDLVYVVGSHFDSVAAGPGADDNTSGTAALLEAARMLARTPLPATVVFASFTGEEAGLLGSREFVRVAAERKWNVLGALNNDMIGYSADKGRMDNTIRYSNAGIRDIQHGASFLFTDLVLYDAKYYRSTDAHAFYDGWGDIVGGIGSYPILANPNYHQSTDFIETMDFQQILETAKVTAATLVHLASSPSRLKDVKAGRAGGGTEVTWTASPETGIRSYIVAYGPAGDPLRTRLTVTTSRATLPALPAGTHVAVKAVNTRGLEGWDWARVVIQ